MSSVTGSRAQASRQRHTDKPLHEAILPVLDAHGMSIRALAAELPITPGHLSRILRRADGKRPNLPLLNRISHVLGLPPDYFAESRMAIVLARVSADDGLVDRLYDELGLDKLARDA